MDEKSTGKNLFNYISIDNTFSFLTDVNLVGGINKTSKLNFYEPSNIGLTYVGLRAPLSIPANVDWVLPSADGAAGTTLKTDGAGNLGWLNTATTYAPIGSAFVTIGNDATLTAERALTGTANQVIITDGGANAAVTLSTPQNIHTAANPTFATLNLTNVLNTGDFLNSAPSSGDLQIKRTGTSLGIIYLNNYNYFIAGGDATSDMRFGTSGAYQFFVSSTGNTSSVALKVTGGINAGAISANSTFIDNQGISVGRVIVVGADAATKGIFKVNQMNSNNTSSFNGLVLDSAGNLTLNTGTLRPSADSTTALLLQNAAGGTSVLTVDTTNSRVGIGQTPLNTLDVYKSQNAVGVILSKNDNTGISAAAGIKLTANSGDTYLYRTSSAYTSYPNMSIWQNTGGADFMVFGASEICRFINATQAVNFAGVPRFNGTNSTGAGSAALGANCPAVTVANPYTWISVTTSDGSPAFIPAWK